MKLATEDRSDPRLHQPYVLKAATLFYGDRPSPITLSERWQNASPAYVEDHLGVLCEELSYIVGRTLSPAEVYRRAKLGFADLGAAVPDWTGVDPETKARLLAMPVYFVVHGNGFNISWTPAPEAAS